MAGDQRPFWMLSITPARMATVLDEIVGGSVPRPMYYVLLGISVLIAGFGLLTDSPAVVIGAMLVSPLMMPIFGVSLGLARAEFPLLRSALISEFGGVALAIVLAWMLGMLPLSFTVTPEMLARTSPTLMDLFVAGLAGLAGCLAMIDERISPALPGVAIATALTPPLAACGVSLAFGEYYGAWGAFLLFFANFLAILAVSTVVFIMAGFVTLEQVGSARDVARRYGAAFVGLLVVTFLLTQQLVRIVERRHITQTVTRVVQAQLADQPNATLMEVLHDRKDGRLRVLSVLRTAHVPSSRRVQAIEQVLGNELAEPVDLYFRCAITKDIGSTGSVNLLAQRNLNGGFTDASLSSDGNILMVAEQTIRDLLLDVQSMRLDEVSLAHLPVGPVVIASIHTPFRILDLHVARVEEELRSRLEDSSVHVVIRSVLAADTTSEGNILFGESHFVEQSEEERAAATEIHAATKARLQALPDIFAPELDVVRREQGWAVRAEVYGPRVPSPEQVRAIEAALEARFGVPVELMLRASTEIVVTGKRYETIHDLVTKATRERRRQREATEQEAHEQAPPREAEDRPGVEQGR